MCGGLAGGGECDQWNSEGWVLPGTLSADNSADNDEDGGGDDTQVTTTTTQRQQYYFYYNHTLGIVLFEIIIRNQF